MIILTAASRHNVSCPGYKGSIAQVAEYQTHHIQNAIFAFENQVKFQWLNDVMALRGLLKKVEFPSVIIRSTIFMDSAQPERYPLVSSSRSTPSTPCDDKRTHKNFPTSSWSAPQHLHSPMFVSRLLKVTGLLPAIRAVFTLADCRRRSSWL